MSSVIRSAEFVLPGHPDKLSDAIADALVQEAVRREQRALCGVEVAVHRSSVFLTGRVACQSAEAIDIPGLVRQVYSTAGYGSDWAPAPQDLQIVTELCLGPLEEGEADFRSVSDDQSIVTGYAVDLPGTNFLPPEHWLAWRLGRRLSRLRTEAPALHLGPDGKVLVLLEETGNGYRLASLSASLQQKTTGSLVELHRAVLVGLQEELSLAVNEIPGLNPTIPETIIVNGAGNFAVGGPEGDNGLSGKKLVVDAYGPRVPIGGGALSGKDFFKADRAGALLARRLAKVVVMTGAARECLATLAFVPGAHEAKVLSLQGDGKSLDPDRWTRFLNLSLVGVTERFMNGMDLVDVARYGHFTDPRRPWEWLGFDGQPVPVRAFFG